MKNLEESHLIDYFILFTGLSIFVLLLYFFNYDTVISLILIAGGSLFYVFWGIIHHALEKRLYKEVILEYLLIGLFIFLLLSLVKLN